MRADSWPSVSRASSRSSGSAAVNPGQLNLGYLFKFNFDLLPATLADFYKTCPDMAVNLFDMYPSDQLRALEARKIDLGFVGLRPPASIANTGSLTWECGRTARDRGGSSGPSSAGKEGQNQTHGPQIDVFRHDVRGETHPGSRDWLTALCQEKNFTPRILQDVALESGLMTFVAEGLGVTLAREQIRKLPHPGVVFRPLAEPVKVDYWIAWHRGNNSKPLGQYIEIVKKEAPAWH